METKENEVKAKSELRPSMGTPGLTNAMKVMVDTKIPLNGSLMSQEPPLFRDAIDVTTAASLARSP